MADQIKVFAAAADKATNLVDKVPNLQGSLVDKSAILQDAMTAPDDLVARLREECRTWGSCGSGDGAAPLMLLLADAADEIERLREFEGFRGEQLAQIVALGVRADKAEAESARLLAELQVVIGERDRISGLHADAMRMVNSAEAERDALRDVLIGICIKCRSNEWGADTPRKTILNWMHDTASAAIDAAREGK